VLPLPFLNLLSENGEDDVNDTSKDLLVFTAGFPVWLSRSSFRASETAAIEYIETKTTYLDPNISIFTDISVKQ